MTDIVEELNSKAHESDLLRARRLRSKSCAAP